MKKLLSLFTVLSISVVLVQNAHAENSLGKAAVAVSSIWNAANPIATEEALDVSTPCALPMIPVSARAETIPNTGKRRDSAATVFKQQQDRPSPQTTDGKSGRTTTPERRPASTQPTIMHSEPLAYSGSGKFGIYATMKDKVVQLFDIERETPKFDLRHLSAGSYMCKIGAEVSKLFIR